MYLMWHDSYGVGYDPIDDQHRMLFSISNDLVDAVQGEDADEAELRRIVDALLDYTRTHFAAEEQLMERTKYPALARHRALHDAFDGRIREQEERVRNGEVRAVAAALPELVGDWLLDHIATEDQLYAAYVKAALAAEA